MIAQMEPWLGPEERIAVDAYLASGGWLTEFKKTEEFAEALARFVGAKHAFIASNGTASVFLALAAAGVGQGDEVIVPDYTMIASANAVLLAGATPVFIDVDRDVFCLDLDRVESAITAKTRAILLVSINGRAPDMHRARVMADRHGVALVEDAAQSLGARWSGRHLGTFGVAGSFSFSAPKIITTGQGGAVVTDDDALADRVRKLRDFGRRQSGVDFHETIGFNFKFTDLQAVIGLEQMKKLDWRVTRKKDIFRRYLNNLADIDEVTFPPTNLVEVPPWFVDILVPNRDGLREYLGTQQIGSRPFYPAIHSQPAYGRRGTFPNAEHAAAHGLWLPSASSLTDQAIDTVCDAIRSFYRR